MSVQYKDKTRVSRAAVRLRLNTGKRHLGVEVWDEKEDERATRSALQLRLLGLLHPVVLEQGKPRCTRR